MDDETSASPTGSAQRDVDLVANAGLSRLAFDANRLERQAITSLLVPSERPVHIVAATFGARPGLLALTTERVLFVSGKKFFLPSKRRTIREVPFPELAAFWATSRTEKHFNFHLVGSADSSSLDLLITDPGSRSASRAHEEIWSALAEVATEASARTAALAPITESPALAAYGSELSVLVSVLGATERPMLAIGAVDGKTFGLLALSPERARFVHARRFLLFPMQKPAVRDIPYSDIAAVWVTAGTGLRLAFAMSSGVATDLDLHLFPENAAPGAPTRADVYSLTRDGLTPAAAARTDALRGALEPFASTVVAVHQRAVAALARSLEPGERVERVVLPDGLLALTDRRIVQIRRQQRSRRRVRITTIEYRALRSVDMLGERDWSPSEGPGGAWQVQSIGTPLTTEVVISSNMDEPPIKVEFFGRGHREQARELDAAITICRRKDYERRSREADSK